MKQSTLDYIKTLSKSDTKTLVQKTLKTVEEVGELAKVVLPYENAFATTHRFVNKSQILEEVADSILCLYSIAYNIDATDEDIEQMVTHKMMKWADLQAREGRIKYPIPFEIHVTVNMTGYTTDKGFKQDQLDVEAFKDVCKEIGVKPILLDLHLQEGAVIKDLMTSSVVMGDNRKAYCEMKRISTELSECGYDLIREKIETIPWHPAAPSDKHQNPVMPPSCYFESHLNTYCTEDIREDLARIASKHGAKMSSNVFKKFDDGSFTIMVTLRNYSDVFEKFKLQLEALKTDLANANFVVEKEIVEFSVFDTKVSHDSSWITA